MSRPTCHLSRPRRNTRRTAPLPVQTGRSGAVSESRTATPSSAQGWVSAWRSSPISRASRAAISPKTISRACTITCATSCASRASRSTASSTARIIPDGEVPELAIVCSCRKPEPGMLIDAAAALTVDLERSWFVGDILSDIEAGNRAGCRTVLVDLGTESAPDSTDANAPLRRTRHRARAPHHSVGRADRSGGRHWLPARRLATIRRNAPELTTHGRGRK